MWYVLGVLELKKPIPCEKVIIVENDVDNDSSQPFLSLSPPPMLSYLVSEDKGVKEIKLVFLCFFFFNGERKDLLKGFSEENSIGSAVADKAFVF